MQTYLWKSIFLLETGFWDDDLAPLARDISTHICQNKNAVQIETKRSKVLKMLNDQADFEKSTN